ncbi:MAG: hypothetical protein M1816_001617 [Peltula sp. TS41687]|nr:MAG: hypothetical protein M1816_001617 [Peltula sp. TS41687]
MNMHGQREVKGPSRGRHRNERWNLPSDETIARSIRDARQTVTDLTEPAKPKLGGRERPIVVDLEDSPPPMPKSGPFRPDGSVHAGLTALREILESTQSSKSPPYGKSGERPNSERRTSNQPVSGDIRANQVHESLDRLEHTKSIQEQHRQKRTQLANPWSVSERAPSIRRRQAHESLVHNDPVQEHHERETELANPWSVSEKAPDIRTSLGGFEHNDRDQQHNRQNETERANPWTVSEKASSRLTRHGGSVAGAQPKDQSTANTRSSSNTTSVVIKGKRLPRDSVKGRKGRKKRNKKGERKEDSFRTHYFVSDEEEEEDWHEPNSKRTGDDQNRIKIRQHGEAPTKTTTEILLDHMRSVIQDLIRQMAKNRESCIKLLLTDAQKANETLRTKMWSSATTFSGGHSRRLSPLAQIDSRHRAVQKAHRPKLKFDLEVFDSTRQVKEVEVCYTTYSSKEATVPRYKSYTAVKSNILSADDDILRYMPYFDEREPEDMNSLGEHFRDVVKELPLKHRRDEQAKTLLPLVREVLERYGCSIDDAIYCIMDSRTSMQANEESPESELDEISSETSESELGLEAISMTKGVRLGERRRERLMASLGPRGEQRIHMAAEVCKAFLDVTGLHIWEVIKQDARISKLLMHEKLGKTITDQKGVPQVQKAHLKCMTAPSMVNTMIGMCGNVSPVFRVRALLLFIPCRLQSMASGQVDLAPLSWTRGILAPKAVI